MVIACVTSTRLLKCLCTVIIDRNLCEQSGMLTPSGNHFTSSPGAAANLCPIPRPMIMFDCIAYWGEVL